MERTNFLIKFNELQENLSKKELLRLLATLCQKAKKPLTNLCQKAISQKATGLLAFCAKPGPGLSLILFKLMYFLNKMIDKQ